MAHILILLGVGVLPLYTNILLIWNQNQIGNRNKIGTSDILFFR